MPYRFFRPITRITCAAAASALIITFVKVLSIKIALIWIPSVARWKIAGIMRTVRTWNECSLQIKPELLLRSRRPRLRTIRTCVTQVLQGKTTNFEARWSREETNLTFCLASVSQFMSLKKGWDFTYKIMECKCKFKAVFCSKLQMKQALTTSTEQISST